jgi:hypothetical protein
MAKRNMNGRLFRGAARLDPARESTGCRFCDILTRTYLKIA